MTSSNGRIKKENIFDTDKFTKIVNKIFSRESKDSQTNESFLKQNDDLLKPLEFPPLIQIGISTKCNLQCSQCYYPVYSKKKGYKAEFMNFNIYKKIIDEVEKFPSETILRFLGRGESLMHPRAIKMLKYAKSKLKGPIALITNGHLLSVRKAISLGNIEYLEYVAALAHRLGCYVSYIPMRNLGNASEEMLNELLNSNEMEQIARIVTSLRAKYSPTRLLTYFDIVAEESDYYHPMFQITPCHARKNIFMTNKGDIFPCDHLVALGDLFKGGNIREKELLGIWKEGKGLQKYRSLEHNQKCLGCNNFGKKCHGGCPSEVLVASGGKETKVVRDRLCFFQSPK